jgi:hypothetical protein
MNLNDLFTEEKVRLDPKCWTGKKIGNPKTKMKGGTRVNNCVPAESVNEMDKSQTPPGRDGSNDSDAGKKEYTAKATTPEKVAKHGEKILNKVLNKKKGVAEGSLEEIDRRGFLKGLGAAAVAGAAGSAMAQSRPVDVSREFQNMRQDDPRVQHNKDIEEMARAIYEQIVATRGQPIDRRQQQMWMTIAREKATEKLSKYAPGRPAPQSQSSGFPAQGSERRVSRNIDNFESQGVAEEQHSCPQCGGEMVSEELMNEKKDACYYKVKSRYKVWPSAYASGALVKCRKKGADSWGNGGKKNESSILEGIEQADESLHDWFTKEKWVRMDTKGNIKGPCAREPGEGKPKCLPQSKAHSLGKKGRASAAARKRREDPNPDRRGSAINVNTKRKTNEVNDERLPT